LQWQRPSQRLAPLRTHLAALTSNAAIARRRLSDARRTVGKRSGCGCSSGAPNCAATIESRKSAFNHLPHKTHAMRRGGCKYCNPATTKTNGPASRGQVPRRNNTQSHCHSLPYAACDRQRFELICGQTWQNKCKHFGKSRRTYTSRQCTYPSIRWTHDLDLEMVGSQNHKVIFWERHESFIQGRK
jgi:hypothetical protein